MENETVLFKDCLQHTPNVLRVFTARSRRKNLVEQTLLRGACISLEF